MKNRGWLATVSVLFLGLFFGVTAAQAQHDHFDDHDRQVARDWYHHHPDAFRHDEGRYWHKAWEANIHEGFVLTPDMRAGIRPVPHDLLVTLAPPPHYRYVIIGDHIVLIDNGYRIHDVLHLELNL